MKNHLQLDIRAAGDRSLGPCESSPKEHIPFFGSSSLRTQNTWIISLFVVLDIVTFVATMFANNCSENSHDECSMKFLRRVSFQPLTENPLLGPSSSTLVAMGALQRTMIVKQNQKWRLVTCFWLHAGLIHLILNLASIIFIGLRLEQAFGPLRVGTIYLLSAFNGSLVSALFVKHSPAVGSSGALFGLLGALLSDLARNWKIYSNKFAALSLLSVIGITNFALGLLPHVDSYSSIGGLMSGLLLGLVLLFDPRLGKKQRKGLFDFDIKSSVKLKQKLDKPFLRVVALLIFGLIFALGLVAVLQGANGNLYCRWCHYIDCVPIRGWSCNNKEVACEAIVNRGRLTLTCRSNDNFRVFPFANISQARLSDLCTQICS